MTDRIKYDLTLYNFPESIDMYDLSTLKDYIKKVLRDAGFKRVSLKFKEIMEI